MMLAKFRHQYPQGSLVSELVKIDRGTYIVKALVQIDRVVLSTALASGNTVEAAEDAAKERAIALLFLESTESATPSQSDRPESNVSADLPSSPPNSSVEVNSASNHKIVNFSKSQSEPAVTTPELAVDTPPPTAAPTPQPNLDASPEPNLFSDTLNAPSPEIAPPASNSASPMVNEAARGDELEAMDFNEIKQKTDIEIRRLGWTKEQGRDFLMSRYGKRSRLHLKDEQLIEFLHYLEGLPNPVS